MIAGVTFFIFIIGILICEFLMEQFLYRVYPYTIKLDDGLYTFSMLEVSKNYFPEEKIDESLVKLLESPILSKYSGFNSTI